MLKFVWHDLKNSKHSCLLLLCRRWHTCTMVHGCISSLRSFIPGSSAARKVFEFRVFFWSVSFSIQTAYGFISVFSPDMGKNGPEKRRVWYFPHSVISVNIWKSTERCTFQFCLSLRFSSPIHYFVKWKSPIYETRKLCCTYWCKRSLTDWFIFPVNM